MKDGGWSNQMKTCAVCKNLFIVRKNAKTADTRNLCFKCRRDVKQTVRDIKKEVEN